jgi:hypothetical protein
MRFDTGHTYRNGEGLGATQNAEEEMQHGGPGFEAKRSAFYDTSFYFTTGFTRNDNPMK